MPGNMNVKKVVIAFTLGKLRTVLSPQGLNLIHIVYED
jgi:hypothetical protein